MSVKKWYEVIMQREAHRKSRLTPVALCFLLSLLIHGGVAGSLPYALHLVVRHQPVQEAPPLQRALQIITSKPEPTEQVRKDPELFVKTDPDQPEETPEEADFRGKRNSAESAAALAPDRYADAPLPTQNGEEDTPEIITFDQNEQDGDLAHDGATPSGSSASPSSSSISPDPAMADQAESTDDPQDDTPAEGTAAITPIPPAEEGNILLQNTPEQSETGSPIKIDREKQPRIARPSAVQQAFYDPSLASHMQQRGFRTRERRTRSTGRFVIGSKPSLNVAATPLGNYEEEIYRRIAYFWYRACDDHRGDIIPGSIVISLRINTRGLLENMELVRRRGASITQQAFTFGAIRRATLPPMPENVRKDIVGDLLEVIFQFNFD